MVDIIQDQLTLSDLAVYVSIGVAAALAIVIICLQCRIIQLQRFLARKGIFGKRSGSSQDSASPPVPVPSGGGSNPHNNISVEMTDILTAEESTSTPHTNTTPMRTADAENSQLDLDDSMAPGYDTVMKFKASSGSSKPIGYEDMDVLGKQAKSPMCPAKPTEYEDLDDMEQSVKVSSIHPVRRMCYEDIDHADTATKVSSHSLNRIGYEDIDKPVLSQVHSQKSSRFQIKVTPHQPKVNTDQVKNEGKTGENDTATVTLPLYSVINKPKKKRVKYGDAGKEDSDSKTLPTYSVVNKPQKKKHMLNGSVATAIADEPSLHFQTDGQDGVQVGEECESFSTHDEISTKVSTPNSIGKAPFNNVAGFDPLLQPLYSNCREIEEMNDTDLGDVSSREPAPPPIPLRSYSAGWSDMNALAAGSGDSDATEKSSSPERVDVGQINILRLNN